jgi:hypothetical protein
LRQIDIYEDIDRNICLYCVCVFVCVWRWSAHLLVRRVDGMEPEGLVWERETEREREREREREL